MLNALVNYLMRKSLKLLINDAVDVNSEDEDEEPQPKRIISNSEAFECIEKLNQYFGSVGDQTGFIECASLYKKVMSHQYNNMKQSKINQYFSKQSK